MQSKVALVLQAVAFNLEYFIPTGDMEPAGQPEEGCWSLVTRDPESVYRASVVSDKSSFVGQIEIEGYAKKLYFVQLVGQFDQ